MNPKCVLFVYCYCATERSKPGVVFSLVLEYKGVGGLVS